MSDSHERFHHLIENLNDAVYTVDIKTNVFTSLNPAARRLTGYTEKELIGGKITTIITPESLALVAKMIQQKLKKDRPTVYEIEILHKNGRRIPVEISSRVMYKNGKPDEILGIARDITERKQAERQKEIFFSLITHEIKNPLTTIKMYAELLKKKAGKRKDGKEEQMLTIVQQQVEAITQLMNDFIEVNRLQLGKFSIVKAPFDLNKAVREVVESFAESPQVPKIQIKGRIHKKVLADEQRICQVIINLLSNAIKYSAGAKYIGITLSERKGMVMVSVQDFGMGIPRGEQKVIFDLFYRIREGKHGEVQGHGLGLFICHEIIKSHKGKIWVVSEVGKGSTFSFSLPTA
jgi:two-component system sensor histidine kinase VicK